MGWPAGGPGTISRTEYLGKTHFGCLITVCARAEERCPSAFPGVSQRLFWDIPAPVAVDGSDAERLAAFRSARDEVEARVQGWLQEQGIVPARQAS